jgi:large subunit ribosomal protein L17
MRHAKKGRTFGRKKGQRVELVRSLARSLVLEGAIVTTVAKAKEVRPFVEKLVTLGKSGTVSARRLAASRLKNDQEVMGKLFGDIAKKYAERAGGYARIVKLGKIGKQATESARIELV